MSELITCWPDGLQTVLEIHEDGTVYIEQDSYAKGGCYDAVELDRAAAHALYRALKNRFEN
jgi:hypothetical protein